MSYIKVFTHEAGHPASPQRNDRHGGNACHSAMLQIRLQIKFNFKRHVCTCQYASKYVIDSCILPQVSSLALPSHLNGLRKANIERAGKLFTTYVLEGTCGTPMIKCQPALNRRFDKSCAARNTVVYGGARCCPVPEAKGNMLLPIVVIKTPHFCLLV